MKNKDTKSILILTALFVGLIVSSLAASVPRPILGAPGTYYTYTGALQYARDTNNAWSNATETYFRTYYTLSGQTSGTNAGTYTVTAKLKDPGEDDDYWNDGGGTRHYAPENFYWTIEPLNLWDKTISLSGNSFGYDGAAKTPFEGIAGYPNLKPDDIHVTYSKLGSASAAPADVGTWTVSVKGRAPNLTDHTVSTTFSITQLDLSGKGISLSSGPYVFHTGEWRPSVSVDGYPNLKASDYAVSYANNVNAGTATVTVTGKAPNCTGSTSTTFDITPAPLPSHPRLAYGSQIYDGTPKQPAATIAGLVEGRDFELAYDADITNAGGKTVTATGKGNYSASSQLFSTYTITRRPLSAGYVNIAGIDDLVFTGEPLVPQPALTFSGMTLSRETDFSYSYGDNTNVGDGRVTVTARDPGNYAGRQTVHFTIIPQPVPVPAAAQVLTYSGLLQDAPVPHDARYILSGALNATDAGTHGLTASLISGNYRWEDNGATQRPVAWQIDTLSLDRLSIDGIPAQLYTGSQIVPEVTARLDGRVMAPQTGFALLYGANIRAGEGAGVVALHPAGPANYTPGTNQSAAFDITPKSLADADVVIDHVADVTYTGLRIMPTPRIAYLGNTLSEGTDFTYSYGENTHAGNAHTLTITALDGGDYQGSKTVLFAITPKSLADEQLVMAPVAPRVYSGLQQRPVPGTVYLQNTLAEGKDFSFSYGENTVVGSEHTVTITATADGNYCDQKTITFTILPRDIADEAVSVAPLAQPFAYSAEEHRPTPVVSYDNGTLKADLVEDVDFSYSYRANIHGGMALSPEADKPIVTLTGKGNFTGTRQLLFVITDTMPPEITIMEDRGGEITFLVKDNWGLQQVGADRSSRVLIDDTFSAIPPVNSKEYTVTFRLPGVYYLKATDLYGHEAVYGPVSYRDNDGDGLSDNYERMIGTYRFESDTDGDGLSDGDEVLRHHTDPRRADGDKDGIPDMQEINTLYNPRLYSTNGSGLSDGAMLLLSRFAADSAAAEEDMPPVFVSDTLLGDGRLRALTNDGDYALRIRGERITPVGAPQSDSVRVDATKLHPVWADTSSGVVLGIQDGLLLTFSSQREGTYRLTEALALYEGDIGREFAEAAPVTRVNAAQSMLLMGLRAQTETICAGPLILYDIKAGRAYAVVGSQGADDFGFAADGTGISYQCAGQVHTLQCFTQ